MRIVMLGAPGSGKGTQARLISTKYGAVHLSMGSMLRDEVAEQTEIGRSIGGTLSKGDMVSDSIVNMLIESQLHSYESVILDGYPRNLEQAEHLDEYLLEHPPRLDVVFLLELPLESVIRRLSGRRVCDRCSRTYHVDFYRLKTCPCGGTLIRRSDDNPTTIEHRMEVYKKEIAPLRNFYQEQDKLFPIIADQGVEGTFADISRVLDGVILPSIKVPNQAK
ncbi:MAG: nucleoside monophosphate kinase [Firmicutes bacterium]|nr:nucleoside monophosphate kinase [Bacillota bacterium]